MLCCTDALGGVVYGRYTADPAKRPPATTKQSQSDGFFGAHPHHQLWRQLPALLSDGWIFAQTTAGFPPKGASPWEKLNEELDKDADLVPAASGSGGKAGRKAKKKKGRKSEPALEDEASPLDGGNKVKKKKKRPKPRASLPVLRQSGDGDGGLE
jgi:hypothetical protein